MFSRIARPASRMVRSQRRGFGAQAEVEYEGFEKVVRGVLPKDEHVVAGILGGYFALYLVFKGVSAVGGKKEAAPVVAAAAPASASSAIPSVEDENFGKWIEEPSNLEKIIASIEK
ncbi:hypothetical protein TrCOL_g4279 [Triparma columacea]|uniref:Uncharacterized protein n=1 Tax=Triparma columacea TaxID=722753 RepID=A0A9W7GEP7_9STRA|nr:hypothetical protein TrCOL_g4279 [Triparma columacea]